MEEEVVDWTCEEEEEEEEIFLFLPLPPSSNAQRRLEHNTFTHTHRKRGGEKKRNLRQMRVRTAASDSLREERGGTTTTEEGLLGTLEATGKKASERKSPTTDSPLYTNELALFFRSSSFLLSSSLLHSGQCQPESCAEREREKGEQKEEGVALTP